MLFVGDDWAQDHHDVYLMDEAGARLAARRLPEGLAGIGQLHELIANHAEDPAEVIIGIETDRGLWVGALAAGGYQVYAINPMAVARYRDRHRVSGAKSDGADAKLLADLVRTDRHNHRALDGDSPQAEAVKVLARAHQSLIWTRARQASMLRSALRKYYPAALRARAGCPTEPEQDRGGTQSWWTQTQYRRTSPRNPSDDAHRASRRTRDTHSCIRRHHPRHGQHFARTH